ncbi:MAG: branched-chain amino acid aminotransferase, partial [Saprospiraceae bacterium]
MQALHYGQSVFEGMKAFRMVDGNVSIFRMDKHYDRFQKSLERMAMADVPYELFTEGIKTLIQLDAAWVPNTEGSSLYIRPFAFASEEVFGAKPSDEYQFIIFSGPVGPYYPKPLRVKVEDHYIRAAKGGTGFAKCAGNYGGAFYPAALARQAGFDQVLWTDGSPELNIEESGTMNVFFLIGDTLVTPPLSDTILDGVTRDSYLLLGRELGYHVEERTISAFELAEAHQKGQLKEAFGAGTAAVAAPIASIHIKGTDYNLPSYHENSLCMRAKKRLTDIRTGAAEDIYGWNTIIEAR